MAGMISTSASKSSGSQRDPAPRIPPLENGDRLTRAEFERRYTAMPRVKKAELIEGIVYMPSPVNQDRHAGPHSDVVYWLKHYAVRTPGAQTGDNPTLRLDLDNEPQPDVCLFIHPSFGGRSKLVDGYLEGGVELVAEVANSSVSIDMHSKLNVYRRNGVLEYFVWRVMDGEIDWFVLRDGIYEKLQQTASGILQSIVFPGLWLNPAALLKGDMLSVAKTVEQGVATPEHAEFVKSLQANAAKLQK
jgi:Uma2 family endonuclease